MLGKEFNVPKAAGEIGVSWLTCVAVFCFLITFQLIKKSGNDFFTKRRDDKFGIQL